MPPPAGRSPCSGVHCAGRLGYALGLVTAHLSRLFPSAIDAVSWLQIVRPGRAAGWAAAAARVARTRPGLHRRASFSEEFELAAAAAAPSDLDPLEWTRTRGSGTRPPYRHGGGSGGGCCGDKKACDGGGGGGAAGREGASQGLIGQAESESRLTGMRRCPSRRFWD